ncbi:MAG: pyruvate dehydrogenase (acetyl-transferring) E1 component subunit alpha [Betaproteobacteria bacterium]|nr:pyruvate dehydrogenase (acetyl-transferring) E1 component subunit alpha [Betaproteobacteria bacterium]
MVKPDRETVRGHLHAMLRIRRFEEKCAELYGAGLIRGFLHLYIGEEAVAAGVVPRIAPGDAILATYREHGHALLRGIPARQIMAEMYGKQEGCSHGRGGSMHLFDVSRRFYGGNAIVAGALPMAVGFGLGDRMRGTGAVTACFFGEGAVAEGEFHEAANLASLWKLPVLFCCENNLYAMGTALDRSEADTDLCEKARSYRMEARSVDGMDVFAVAEAARAALEYVRSGAGPLFLELKTYRFRAHSMFDPELYRSREEVEAWRERCPIESLKRTASAAGLLTDEDVASIERAIATEIDDAVAFAEAGTWEPVDTLARDVYARASGGSS